ncbi:hypothetical protein D3C78_1735480 [compost metagenome]
MRQRNVHVACGAYDLAGALLHDDKGQASARLGAFQRARHVAPHVVDRCDGFRLQAPEFGMQAHLRQRFGMVRGHGLQAHDVAMERDGVQGR